MIAFFASSGVLYCFSCPYISTYLRLVFLCFIICKFPLVIGLKISVLLFMLLTKFQQQFFFCQTPFKLLIHVYPMYANFQPFGCRVFPCLRPYVKNKFSPRSSPCIFFGYSTQQKGFKCMDTQPQGFMSLFMLNLMSYNSLLWVLIVLNQHILLSSLFS